MKKLFIILLSFYPLLSSSPDTLWTKVYGTSLNEYGRGILETQDGGYIISSSWGGYIYFIKTDENGNILWMRGYSGGKIEMIGDMNIQQASDGGYVIVGTTTNYDFYLIKVDSMGNLLWVKNINVVWSENGYAIVNTPDNGFLITGFASYSVGIAKTDSEGNVLWTKSYAFSSDSTVYPYSITRVADGYIITGLKGYSHEAPPYLPYVRKIFILKINETGDSLWMKKLEGISLSNSTPDEGYSVWGTSDGGFVLTGCQYSYGRSEDICLIKFDSSGNIEWRKKFGASGDDRGYAVRETSDGGFIVVGKKQVFFNKGYDVWVIKTNSNGDTLWTKTIGGSGEDVGSCIQETQDGNYIITGWTNSFGAGGYDLYLIKLAGSVNKEEKPALRKNFVLERRSYFFTDKIILNFSSLPKGERFKGIILNPAGAKIYEKEFISPYFFVNKGIKKFSPGVYFLRILKNNKKIGEYKLIKKGGA